MSWFLRISGTVAFGFIEWLLLALIWAIQIGTVLILAAFLALLVQKAEEAIRTKKVKFLPRMLIVFLLLCVILAGFALRPPVTCGDGVCTDLTPDLRETVRIVFVECPLGTHLCSYYGDGGFCCQWGDRAPRGI